MRETTGHDAAAPAASDDDALWREFHNHTLPEPQWTHAAHLRIAWFHLVRYELEEVHLRMRAGIVLLNAVHGLVETPQRGYHETLTGSGSRWSARPAVAPRVATRAGTR